METIIDNKYIDSIYDVEKEKTLVKKELECIGEIVFDFDNFTSEITKKDFLHKIQSELDKYPEDAIIKKDYYGYDGGYNLNVFKRVERLETNPEVYERLKKIEREKRNNEREIEKAKEILAKNNIKVD